MFVSIGKPRSLYDTITNNPANWAPSKRLGGAPEGTTVIAEGRYESSTTRRRRRNSCTLVDLPSFRGWETKSDTGKLEVA